MQPKTSVSKLSTLIRAGAANLVNTPRITPDGTTRLIFETPRDRVVFDGPSRTYPLTRVHSDEEVADYLWSMVARGGRILTWLTKSTWSKDVLWDRFVDGRPVITDVVKPQPKYEWLWNHSTKAGGHYVIDENSGVIMAEFHPATPKNLFRAENEARLLAAKTGEMYVITTVKAVRRVMRDKVTTKVEKL